MKIPRNLSYRTTVRLVRDLAEFRFGFRFVTDRDPKQSHFERLMALALTCLLRLYVYIHLFVLFYCGAFVIIVC